MFLSWTETWNLTSATTCKEDFFSIISLKLSWISLKLCWKELLNHLPAPDSKFATFFPPQGWTFLVSEKGLEISRKMLENERLELSASVIKCIILLHETIGLYCIFTYWLMRKDIKNKEELPSSLRVDCHY